MILCVFSTPELVRSGAVKRSIDAETKRVKGMVVAPFNAFANFF